ncbi:hypothetical protein Taro_028113 [Colocasia esculenta]|uniref:Uncharacterized protein n=1 Tax=Colocasia esculenta TaxID=4460 RepID=A0A843VTA6_COLES|nr:hypothetical protein [Colocasia esculenta]
MEKYEVVQDIESGNFGVARLMRNKETKELVAMKYIESGQKMTGKKVKLLDLENEQVAEGIVMSVDLKKIVMGRPIGHMLVDEAKRSLFSG